MSDDQHTQGQCRFRDSERRILTRPQLTTIIIIDQERPRDNPVRGCVSGSGGLRYARGLTAGWPRRLPGRALRFFQVGRDVMAAASLAGKPRKVIPKVLAVIHADGCT